MAKFHINKHGVPAPCKAKEGNCPLGGSESHFTSREEAQAHADKLLSSEHSILPGVNNSQGKGEREMVAGEKYGVVVNEGEDGSFEREEMTLKEIKEYKGKEIHVFKDDSSYEYVMYDHGDDNIDWDFVEEINEKFGYYQ